MLKQKEVVELLAKEQSQVVTFNILWAFVYSKASRGNLPAEILAKILGIHRKLLYKKMASPSNFPTEAAFNASPMGLAFEAIRRALLDANRRWHLEGPRCFGNLGLIGPTGGSPDAEQAWRKATNGKIKEFAVTSAYELDAGRVNIVVEPPPPSYDAAEDEQPAADNDATATTTDSTNAAETTGTTTNGSGDNANERRGTQTSNNIDIDSGRDHLARMREQMLNGTSPLGMGMTSPRAF